MGSPDGGWYDERPPRVVSATPPDRGTNVTKNKITINFSEFVKLENATEKVVVSPPQKEQPDIKSTGKKVWVTLKDSLKENTTYTIDFSDAISDNNEGNPMGNYTYCFSTGPEIDTLEVSGYVLEADNLEPIKGILVGLFAPGDTVMRRVSRSDSRGYFIIRGVAPGRYAVGAVKDADGDYRFSQRAETMAFSHDTISPAVFTDHRQDTIWADQLHVKDIKVVPFTHYTPDNVVLRAFDHKTTDRFFVKAERKDPECFTLFFTAPLDTPHVKTLPVLRLLNIPDSSVSGDMSPDSATVPDASPSVSDRLFYIEPSQRGDTITYWLRDTALVNQDTLRIEMQTLITDTLGVLQPQTDTLEILSKTPYAKRLKEKQEADEKWQKKLDKAKKKYAKEVAIRRKEGLTEADSAFWADLPKVDSIKPMKYLKPKYNINQSMSPDGTAYIEFTTPMRKVARDSVHLYVEQDSVWYRAPFVFEPVTQDSSSVSGDMSPDSATVPDASPSVPTVVPRQWRFYTDWIPDAEYSLEIDTLAFEDIYGLTSRPYKTGIRVQPLTAYASLFVNVSGIPATAPYRSVQGDAASSAATAPVVGELACPELSRRAPMVDELACPELSRREATPSVIIQMLDASDKPKRTAIAKNGTAEFYYVEPGTYYLRAIIDRNNNGKWDTGDYYADKQPEEVYYNPEPVECKAKWDLTKTWNLTAVPLYKQKPAAITKQKADAAKTIQHRNIQRAQQKGLDASKIPARFM